MATEPVTLGERYRDTLTDYAGVAIARTEFLYSSPEVKLQRLDNDGRPEEFWFDEARLVAEDREPATRTPGFGPHPGQL